MEKEKPEMSLKQKCANVGCSVEFTPRIPWNKYCSKKCKTHAWLQQHPNYFHERYLEISASIIETLKKKRLLKIGTAIKVNGKWVNVQLDAPDKRPRPAYCELCGVPFKANNYAYHHWDNSNPSKGLWVCKTSCHILANSLEKNPLLTSKYFILKEKIELEFTRR